MTKENKGPGGSNEDMIAKIKADEEAKKKAHEEAEAKKKAHEEAEAKKLADAEAARIKTEQEKLDPSINKAPTNEELAKAAAEQAKKIESADKDEGDMPVFDPSDIPARSAPSEMAYTKGRASAEKLRLIAMSYPRTTPDEHVVFGFGGVKYTLGDLRDLTNIR